MLYTISTSQMARAMHLEQIELENLLDRCGVVPQSGYLSREQAETVIRFLEAQQEGCRQRAQKNLERLTGRYTFLVDTCSLLHDQFPALMEHLVPLLRENGKALVIPSGVTAELRRLAVQKPELTDRIRAVAGQLAALKNEGLVAVYGNTGENFGDKQLLTAVTHFMTSTELLVITQDKGLSTDLLNLNQLNSVRGKRVTVGRINQYGYLSRFLLPEQRAGSASWSQSESSTFPKSTLIPENGQRLPVTRNYSVGDLVYGASGPLVLSERLASGGEGSIYDLGDSTVAKLYRPEKLTVNRRDKLALMVTSPVNCPGVCWPQELLYDADGNFVGYRMEKARGIELQRCLFTRPALERYFPHWTKADTVQLCVTILEKISALHRQGIILGDINPLNILVVSPEEVWFVDCDSYQIGGYPCPVGTVRFTAPEIQKQPFSTFLRTPGNEYFAVATLLFMIMLPGKSPYAQQGGSDLSDVIQAMEFPYPCEENRSRNAPEGAWRYLWSHLPLYIKRYFYGTFQRGGQYSEESTRLTTERWLKAFQSYHGLLVSGKMGAQDPESEKIFPSRWKITDPDARTVWQQYTCVECGSTFDISVAERNSFHRRNMALPRRCLTCRKLRKLTRAGYSFSAEPEKEA